MLEKHVMLTPPLPTHLDTQVWNKAPPSLFVIWLSGAGRFGQLQLHMDEHLWVEDLQEMCKIGGKYHYDFF